jgi:hypothetical protein
VCFLPLLPFGLGRLMLFASMALRPYQLEVAHRYEV